MKKPARREGMTPTDLLVDAMQDFGENEIEFVTLIATNRDGSMRRLYSNARSEPEMFGMIHMSTETWTDNVLEDEEE